MKKIVFLFIAIIFISLQTIAQDSTKAKVKELGIGLVNFNNFSLQYRWGNAKTLYRIGGNIGMATAFGNGSGNGSDYYDTSSTRNTTSTSVTKMPINLNVGLNFSLLKLKPISKKFSFMYGGMLGVSFIDTKTINTQTNNTTYTNSYNWYSNSNHRTILNQTLRSSIGVVIGASYQINEHFFVYLEIAPNIYYSYSNLTTTDVSTHNQSGSYYLQSTSSTSKTPNNEFGIANLSNSGAMLTFVYRITK